MKTIVKFLLVALVVGTLGLHPSMVAQAGVPIAYKALPGDTLQQIAIAHQVTFKALMEANPEIQKPKKISPGQWIKLPARAILPKQNVIGLLASGQWEIDEILKEVQVKAVYRIVGREFTVGKWDGKAVVIAVAGGGLNNAAIGTSVLLTHFNVAVVGFVGIAGGGHGTRIGDVCVASGAVQHDQGNWFDFLLPNGDIAPGLTWYMGGQGVIRDSGTTSKLVLVPDPALFDQIQASVASIELPLVGPEVAEFLGVEVYRPSIYTSCWSASGNQFVTSERTLRLLDQRIVLAANQLGIPAPQTNVVDEEDFGAIQTAEEYGVPWFIVRVAVDLARQWDPDRGVPYDLINDPDGIWGWFFENGAPWGNFDWSYFYRQIEIVVNPIVSGLP